MTAIESEPKTEVQSASNPAAFAKVSRSELQSETRNRFSKPSVFIVPSKEYQEINDSIEWFRAYDDSARAGRSDATFIKSEDIEQIVDKFNIKFKAALASKDTDLSEKLKNQGMIRFLLHYGVASTNEKGDGLTLNSSKLQKGIILSSTSDKTYINHEISHYNYATDEDFKQRATIEIRGLPTNKKVALFLMIAETGQYYSLTAVNRMKSDNIDEFYAYLNNQYQNTIRDKNIPEASDTNAALNQIRGMVRDSSPILDLTWSTAKTTNGDKQFLVVTAIDRNTKDPRNLYFAEIAADGRPEINKLSRPSGFSDGLNSPYLIGSDRKYYVYNHTTKQFTQYDNLPR